jgi:hypothetical protein
MSNTPKFRIVYREGEVYPYAAQRKLFNLFWLDWLVSNNFDSLDAYVKRKLEGYNPKPDEIIVTYYNEGDSEDT